jgi:serine phosphatase RsbU (regulator of sigma subunit)
VEELALKPGLMVCGFTDGLIHAGSRKGQALDIPSTMAEIWATDPSAQGIADGLLARALALDENRPVDDTSVAVLHIRPGEGTGPRYLRAELPVPDF